MPVTRRLGERALNVRVPAALYEVAQKIAFQQSQSLAAVTLRALTEFVLRNGVGVIEGESIRRTLSYRPKSCPLCD